METLNTSNNHHLDIGEKETCRDVHFCTACTVILIQAYRRRENKNMSEEGICVTNRSHCEIHSVQLIQG